MKELKERFNYCEVSGNITSIKNGEIANAKHSKGYLCVGKYLAHRVAWFLYYGCEPIGQIDHINQNKTDNRIVNLRCVSNRENHRNMPIQKNNKSGLMGVHFSRLKSKWVSYIKVDGKRIHIGSFSGFFDACCARKSAESKLGFHLNHGKTNL